MNQSEPLIVVTLPDVNVDVNRSCLKHQAQKGQPRHLASFYLKMYRRHTSRFVSVFDGNKVWDEHTITANKVTDWVNQYYT